MGAKYLALGLLLVGAAVPLTAPLPATAKEYHQDYEELKLVLSVAVRVVLDLTDDCPTDPQALKSEAEHILRRAGIAIVDKGVGTEGNFQLGILAQSWRYLTDQCIDRLDVELSRQFGAPPDGRRTIAVAYYRRTILVQTNKSGMQAALRSAVSEIVTDMVNKILKARRE
jgi:hypothetical protein